MLRMHRLWGLAVLLAAGCLREKVQYCNNGALCPEPLVCTERTEEPFCGVMGQVEECLGKPDETPCTVDGAKGVCDVGLCKPCEPNNAACVYETWVAMETPVTQDLSALYVAGPRELYVVGSMGTVIRWDGKAWTALPKTGTSDLKSLAAASPNDMWAAASSDAYHFDGTAWTAAPPANQAIFGIWAAGPNDFFSAGFKSTVGRNLGAGWMYMEDILNPMVVGFNAVWGASNSDVFVVGGVGTIVRWNGSTWSSPMPTPAAHFLLGVHGTSSSNVFAVGRTSALAPVVFRYDGGAWQDLTANLPTGLAGVNLNGVWSTSGHVFAVGNAGTIVHSTDNGASWTTMPVTPASTSVLRGVAGTGKYVFAVGTKGTVLRYEIP